MEDIIKNYLLSHTLDEITKDWNELHCHEETKLDKWFDLMETLESRGDIIASDIYSEALRCFMKIVGESPVKDHNVLYSDENFEKVKEHAINTIKYNHKHSRGADREMWSHTLNNLAKYNLD